MQDVLNEKLSEFGKEADAYRTKSESMRNLTVLDRKKEQGEPFTRDDLVFLYEIDKPIEGFGYGRDPRIAELRKERNPEEDMLVIFDCTKDQIAHVPSEITDNTKAYVGQLEPGIFQKLPEHLEHVYTSFPEKKIRRENLEIGGKTAAELIADLEHAGIHISDYAKDMLMSKEFVPGKNKEEASLVRLTVADLGFRATATTDQIYERAEKLGLELCPADTGPHYRLAHQDQAMDDWTFVAMKPIADRDGYPSFWSVGRGDDGLWLVGYWAGPSDAWSPDNRFLLRLRELKT